MKLILSLFLLAATAFGQAQGVKITPWTSTTNPVTALAALGGTPTTNIINITNIVTIFVVTNRIMSINGTNFGLLNRTGGYWQGRGYVDELDFGTDPSEVGFWSTHNTARGDNQINSFLIESTTNNAFTINPYIYGVTSAETDSSQLILSTGDIGITPHAQIVLRTDPDDTQDAIALYRDGARVFGVTGAGRMTITSGSVSVGFDQSGAGTGPSSVTHEGNAASGKITLTLGNSPQPLSTVLIVNVGGSADAVIMPGNENASNAKVWVSSTDDGFNVNSGTAPLGANSAIQYIWFYHAIRR